MTDMPETIWADAPDIFDGMSLWVSIINDRGTEYLRADVARARVAAAYETAAGKADVLAEACEVLSQTAAKAGDKDDARWHGEAMRTAQDIAAAIRSLTDADARAALDRLLDEARAQEREAAWSIPDVELAAILLAYDEGPNTHEDFDRWKRHWRKVLCRLTDEDEEVGEPLRWALHLAPMVRAAIRARGEAAKAQEGGE